MHTTSTTFSILLPSLPSFPLAPIPPRKPKAARSPYPASRNTIASVASGRKAFSRARSILSSLLKPFKSTSRQTVAAETPDGNTHAAGGQLAPAHASNATAQAQQLQPVPADEYYGCEQVAKTSARFISTLLDCPEALPSCDPNEVNPDLARFIAFALDRLQMPLCVHHYAVHLIWRLRCISPDFKPKHAHGTYLTALMLATKHSHDVNYPLKDWASVGQNIFEPWQLRDNEWRMCERLGWTFQVNPMDLVKVAWTVQVEYGEPSGDAPASGPIVHTESEVGLSGMFAASVASSLSSMSSLSTPSSGGLSSAWSGWGEGTPSDSSVSTPRSNVLTCSGDSD